MLRRERIVKAIGLTPIPTDFRVNLVYPVDLCIRSRLFLFSNGGSFHLLLLSLVFLFLLTFPFLFYLRLLLIVLLELVKALSEFC